MEARPMDFGNMRCERCGHRASEHVITSGLVGTCACGCRFLFPKEIHPRLSATDEAWLRRQLEGLGKEGA